MQQAGSGFILISQRSAHLLRSTAYVEYSNDNFVSSILRKYYGSYRFSKWKHNGNSRILSSSCKPSCRCSLWNSYCSYASDCSVRSCSSRGNNTCSSGTRNSSSSSNSGLLTHSNILSVTNRQRCQASLRSSTSMKLKPYWPSGIPLEEMRQAGVLVSLCTVAGEPSFIFTLRSKSMTGYSGQVSFPGGMADKDDKDIIETVLREADEEIGIKRSSIDVWGKLVTIPGKDFNVAVTPVVGFCGEVDLASLKVNPKEVSEVFISSVESLCLPTNSRYTTFRGTRLYTMPAFDGQKYRIWGLTASVLHQALQLIAPGLYTNKMTFRR